MRANGIDQADIDKAWLGRHQPEMTLAYVAENGRPIGLFGYADALRREAPAALDIAAATPLKIRQNLFWAFIYNVIGIPLAAFGLLTPAQAGAAMAMSSVSVVTNAGLLTRWAPKLPAVGPAKD